MLGVFFTRRLFRDGGWFAFFLRGLATYSIMANRNLSLILANWLKFNHFNA